MHIWIDIDNPKHTPFYKALISELKEKGHLVTVTAENTNEIKKALNEHSLDTKLIGVSFSIFGLFEESFHLFRAALISSHIKEKNIDVAFSCGSYPMLYECSSTNLPIILFIDNTEEKLHNFYFGLEKSFFMISDTIPTQSLIDKGAESNKIARYKGSIKKDDKNPDLKAIKEIASKIEFLSKHVPGGISA